jgi:proton-translocating NADH-quinone oxidoreductase chain N
MGDSWVIYPLVSIVGGAFFVYIIARLVTKRNAVLACITTIVLALALILVGVLDVRTRLNPATDTPVWGGFEPGAVYLQADPGALLISEVALALSVFVALFSGRYLALDKRYETYYPLLLLLIAGLIGMVLTMDLFNLYLFCELMSIATYVLVAFRRQTDTAIEAGFKYLIMGSVGTITMLLGISFVYRATGKLSLPIPNTMESIEGRIGLGCLMVGLGIKSAIVPLHTWLPDAHGRAPSSISTLLSGIVIQSAFYAFLKVTLSLGFPSDRLGGWLLGIAVLNMSVGNIMALAQQHTKRLLAFSTVAQMGYILFGIGVGLRYANPRAVQAGFYLLIAHAGMKGLAFLCKGIYHFVFNVTTIDELNGLAWSLPMTALCFALALASLAGIPPFAGFAGKWFILIEILTEADGWLYAGLLVFLINTLIALGYYLPLIITLFSPVHPDAAPPAQLSGWMSIPVAVLSVFILVMGVMPNPWLTLTSRIGPYLLALGR